MTDCIEREISDSNKLYYRICSKKQRKKLLQPTRLVNSF